jgi:HAD superfamily hydrolase (TIGR01459 family)
VKNDLAQKGLTPNLYQNVHTSGEDTYHSLTVSLRPEYGPLGKRCYILTSQHHAHLVTDCALERVGTLEEAHFIFNTGLDTFSPRDMVLIEELLDEAAERLLPMICVNPDITVIYGGDIIPCAGSIAQRFEQKGGEVFYHGKPFPSVYDRAINLFSKPYDQKKILAVGDSMTTDIKGAHAYGLDSALVLTGLVGRDVHEPTFESLQTYFDPYGFKPTHILKSLAD